MRAAAEAAATPLTADSDSDSDSGPRGYIHGVRPISGWLKSTARRANWFSPKRKQSGEQRYELSSGDLESYLGNLMPRGNQSLVEA